MPDAQSIGRYRLDRRIGAGAFATVWLAHDDLLESPVAVKVLADNWSERLDIRARFLEEARILRRADSDHVVRVHDIGELEDNRPYFVMTYANGGTLADRLTDGPLPADVALQHARGVADGLAVLHRLGVVHRDVKPSNVLFDAGRENERVLLADLGLARAVAHASGFTLAAGTPGYMAPEQAVMGGSVDARADVYALGALIVNMLTGAVPRTVTNARTAEQALADAEPLPGGLGDVVRTALSPEPSHRYASAVEMAAALGAVRLTPVPAQRAPAVPRPMPLGAAPARDRPSSGESVQRPDSAPPQLPAGRAPTLVGRERMFRSRARRRVWLAVAAVVLCGIAGGAYAVVRSVALGAEQTLHGKGISVTVPRSWAKQLQDDGPWKLDRYGKTGQTGRGLAVAPDIAAWGDSSDPTPGLFVGTSPALRDVDDSTVMAQHQGCSKRQEHTVSGWTVVRWSGCGPAMYDEAIRRPAGYLIYAQIKQRTGGTDETPAILASVQVSTP